MSDGVTRTVVEETTIRPGDRVLYVSNYDIRSGKVVGINEEWGGWRGNRRHAEKRMWVQVARALVDWDKRYAGQAHNRQSSYVDVANLYPFPYPDDVYINGDMLLNRTKIGFNQIRQAIIDGKGIEDMVRMPGQSVDEPLVRLRRETISDRLQSLYRDVIAVEWEKLPHLRVGDAVVYTDGDATYAFAVIDVSVKTERADDV